MNYNYTLKYRTFESLLEDVKIDLRTLTLENRIDPAQLIKVAMRVNYDLGLRINVTKEAILEVEKGRVRLPEDFYVMNYALMLHQGYETIIPAQGTNVQDVTQLGDLGLSKTLVLMYHCLSNQFVSQSVMIILIKLSK